MIIQLCGLSGAGKSTLASITKNKLQQIGVATDIIDGDEYRQALCRDLGFSKADRCENIRRLGFVAGKLSKHGIVVIISAINPYEQMRQELTDTYADVFTVHVDCELQTLIKRDTKGLYKRALLPEGHPDRLNNLTGVNDPFEVPVSPALTLQSGLQQPEFCAGKLFAFIMANAKVLSTPMYVASRQAV